MPKSPEKTHEFAALLEVVSALRGPNGCPWDKEQTHQSLVPFAIEEVYEMVEAIEAGSPEDLKEELGDVLFQVVLHSQLASERDRFSISEVIESISNKMIRRHPHVFTDLKVKSTEEVKKNWQEIKAQEKSSRPKKNWLEAPKGLPSLMEASKIGSQTKNFGFDWDTPEQVFEKIHEEIDELKEAYLQLKNSSAERSEKEKALNQVASEIGDCLFSIAQFARHLKLDPETSLRKTNSRFKARFHHMIHQMNGDIIAFKNLSPSEKESLWSKAKIETE